MLPRRRLAELALLTVGCGSAAAVAGSLVPRIMTERAARRAPISETKQPGVETSTAPGGLLGELRIPSVGLTSPVLESCTEQTLRQGSCHMTGTANIGGLGTSAIAGHRDASFRSLQQVKSGNPITVRTAGGTYLYSIDQTRIVKPEDVDVLAVGDRPGLVLITCYPFHYIGAAPKRFIVEAHLVSASPIEDGKAS